jgi:DNA-binding NtrC family response regulator
LTARTIHDSSDRKEMPFVPMNCSRLAKKTKAEDEVAAQLFEVMKSVGGGTLYLDEISVLSADIRNRVLKLLDETESDSGQRPRLIAGTSKDLDEVIASGAMKESLLDLFNAVFIKMPALRERKEDIPLLINHFLYNDSPASTTRIYGITPSAMNILLEYHWPGNLIQLQNVIERAYAMGVENAIGPEDLPDEIRTFGTISQMG